MAVNKDNFQFQINSSGEMESGSGIFCISKVNNLNQLMEIAQSAELKYHLAKLYNIKRKHLYYCNFAHNDTLRHLATA